MILRVVMEKMIVEVVVIVMKEFELRSDVYVDLVYADAIKELKGIADRMIRSGYEKECCQVYCNVWRDVLDECLSILGVEKVSVEEVQRIGCKVLDEKIRNGFMWLKFFCSGKSSCVSKCSVNRN
ncbi:putative exocyst complex component Exo70, cullin repeat-like-containing domain superfamily [Helianthus annuus]|nr:putative exocyst complex component Exo70, cullin repeat-like-containing domain superfamily [Helianthus annuus]